MAGPAISEETPLDLRGTDLRVGDEHFVVLSYTQVAEPQLLGLSSVESDVVRAACSGLTAAEIATHRGCSVFTIQNHLASVYRKWNVSSRGELCALFARLGGHEA
jgi:DNA-binding CsgD family transcriptional regulator